MRYMPTQTKPRAIWLPKSAAVWWGFINHIHTVGYVIGKLLQHMGGHCGNYNRLAIAATSAPVNLLRGNAIQQVSRHPLKLNPPLADDHATVVHRGAAIFHHPPVQFKYF